MEIKSIVIGVFLLSLCVQNSWAKLSTSTELHASIKRGSTTVTGQTSDEYRAFQANWYPDVDPRIIQLIGVDAKLNKDQTVNVDAVEFIMDDLLQASLFFGYYHSHQSIPDRSGHVADLTAAAFAFAVRAFAVFEYVENNGIPGFQNGTSDQGTGLYDLSSLFLQWKPMQIDAKNVTYNGTQFQVFIVTIQTQDEVFLMRFIAVGYDTEVEGVKVTPTTIKVDFEIRWFNNPLHVPALWTFGPSSASQYPNAHVGMFTAFAAAAGEFSKTTDPVTSKPGIQFAAGNYTGFFQWEPQANVTVAGYEVAGAVYGSIQTINDSSVNASFAEEWILQAGFFSFEADRPALVSWDPEFGAAIAKPAAQGTSSPAVKVETSMVVVLLAIALLFLAAFENPVVV